MSPILVVVLFMGDTFENLGSKLLQVCVIINDLGVLIIYMIIHG